MRLLDALDDDLHFQVSDAGVMQLLVGCPLLCTLHVTNCPGITAEMRGAVALQVPWVKFVA